MSTPVVAFFNNKGGVGKTSLVHHLAWMFSDLGVEVVAADLDPQANLTAALLDDDRIEVLWADDNTRRTVYGGVEPQVRGLGDINEPYVEAVGDHLGLVAGDLALSRFEDELSSQWPDCMDGKERAFRVISSFWRLIQRAAEQRRAAVVLVDLGPNLGAINRAALIASDHVVIPLSPDLFSLQGLRNLGPTFRRWRSEWKERLPKNPARDLGLPAGEMTAAGYIILQQSVRLDRPVKSYEKWIARIPSEYRNSVLDQPEEPSVTVRDDPQNLALLKHYRSLMPMAQEARKPIFHLQAADGAIGAHSYAVRDAFADFRSLALKIAGRVSVKVPASA